MTGQEKNRDFITGNAYSSQRIPRHRLAKIDLPSQLGGLRVKDVITERNVKTANEKNERGRVDR